MNILTVNAGSSSIKLSMFSADADGKTYQGQFEILISDIGQRTATLHVHERGHGKHQLPCAAHNHAAAAKILLDWLVQKVPAADLTTIGHRIVHGGSKFSEAQVLTPAVETELHKLAPLDPEHTPAALYLIDRLRERFPDATQIVCFDTAFFSDLPAVAQLLPLPRKYSKGIRRYGFHGLSYTYLRAALADIAGTEAAHGRVIYAHLGSGASLAATRDGKPIDTTMGLTPASGVMMSTRLGDIDPGVASYLHKEHGLSFADYNKLINTESGLIGVSGMSADMLTLLQAESTHPHAAEAVELFCYNVKKAIGSLAASLGGLDTLVFSGGIGEQAPLIRQRICKDLDFLGIKLDPRRNKHQAPLISADDSRVEVRVIPTQEAYILCELTMQTLARNHNGATHG
jgi:acetate kinase